MQDVLLSQSVEATTEAHLIRATVRETYNASTDETCASTNTAIPFTDPQPTDAVFIANARANSEIYDPATRDETIVTPRNGNNNCWGADFVQFNWQQCQRDVQLEIPISELPSAYSGDDVIAWGRAAGKLLS